jgi:hypothetical protein
MRGRRATGVDKLGNGSDKLGGRERLGQQDAVGHAMGWPFGGVAASHIDNWEFRVDLSGFLCDFPTFDYATQLDVGHKRAVFALVAIQQSHRLLARGGDCGFESAIREGVLDDALQRCIVFDDQDDWLVTQYATPRTAPQRVQAPVTQKGGFYSNLCTQVNLGTSAAVRWVPTGSRTCGIPVTGKEVASYRVRAASRIITEQASPPDGFRACETHRLLSRAW